MKSRLGAVIIVCSLALAGVMVVEAAEWLGASAAVPLPRGAEIRSEQQPALALGAGEMAVVWASEDATRLLLSQKAGDGDWSSPLTLGGGDGEMAWNPAAVYSDSQMFVAWTEGVAPVPGTLARRVMQQDVGIAPAQVVMSNTFGDVVPELAVGPKGMHLIFPAATQSQNWTKADLYHVYRPLEQSTWLSPEIVITHSQVVPAGDVGIVWYPKIALSADGSTIHTVWEQKQTHVAAANSYITHTVWYISGLLQSGNVSWATPHQISPLDQQYALRPNVAVGPNDDVYVIWSEAIIGSAGVTDPDAQYINYRRLVNGQLSDAVRISGSPLLVNDNFPTVSESSMGLYGNRLCVAWHGFYTGEKEETWMRCSPDAGVTWQSVLNVSESSELLSIFPQLAIDVMGRVHVVWVEYDLIISQALPNGIFYRAGMPEMYFALLPVVMKGAH
ncbi:MAG: hypothetical protein JXA33_15650 [Anaerolineae bacterium]|nr:hypothetical protein [Anaerolineae bacterium]